MYNKDIAIRFALWLREVDTPKNAEEWFGFTNEDMFDYFIENEYYKKLLQQEILDIENDYCNKHKWGDCECTNECKRGFKME